MINIRRPIRGFSSSERYITMAFLVVAGFALLFLAMDMMRAFQLPFWRHDAAFYLESYRLKVVNEGRWLNFFVFPAAQIIHPSIYYTLNKLLYISVFYVAFNRATQDRLIAITIALSAVTLPSFHAQFMWPSQQILGPFILLVYFTMLNRHNVFFLNIIAGVLLFGVINNLIFLLPLGLLIFHKPVDLRFFTCWFVSWFGGFIAGALTAYAVVFVGFGRVIQLAAWRRPEPATTLEQFIVNVDYAVSKTFEYLLTNFSLLALAILFFIAVLLIYNLLKAKLLGSLKSLVLICSALLMGFMAVGLQTVPSGIKFALRTAFPSAVMFLAVASLPYVFQKQTFVFRGLIAVGLALVIFTGGLYGLRLKEHFIQAGTILASVVKAVEAEERIETDAFNTLTLYQLREEPWNLHDYVNSRVPRGSQGLNSSNRWGRAFHSPTTRLVRSCHGPFDKRPKYCRELQPKLADFSCSDVVAGFCKAAILADNEVILVIR